MQIVQAIIEEIADIAPDGGKKIWLKRLLQISRKTEEG